MQQISTMATDNLLCKQYKNGDRIFKEYRGFRLSSLKLIVEYSFSGYILKIERNNRDLRFDIYLRKNHKETLQAIDMKEVEKFRKFYGKGFKLILWNQSDDECTD